MKKWSNYTDKDRKEFAEGEYGNFKVGRPYKTGNGKNRQTAGYVRERYGFNKDGSPNASEDGEQAYVVTQEKPSVPKNQVKHVAVIYQGSDTDFLNHPADSISDWADNDLPQAAATEINGAINFATTNSGYSVPYPTPQLIASANTLNQVSAEYPNAQIDVYGHSLASMDGQYAVANMDNPDQLHGAWLYEGPNIYPNLTPSQKEIADESKDKIHNYVDRKDIVPLGYTFNAAYTVGNVILINSEGYQGIGGQHMWGGYYFDANGKLMPDGITNGLESEFKDISKTYTKLAGKNLSSADQVMLNEGTARNILRALDNAIENEYTLVNQLYNKAISKCDELWKESLTRASIIGTNLTKDEIQEALAAGGCTKSKFSDVADYYRSKKHHFESIHTKVTGWIKKLDHSIEQIKGVDAQIAGYFK